MNGKKFLLGLAAVAVVAGAFTVLTGCEKDKDGTDLDRYFKDNPYVSDPRSAPDSRKLEIDPPIKTVTAIGEKIRFAVNGGAGSTYRWDVANTAYGTIERQSNTRHAIYTVKQLVDNSVIVSDSDGSAGIAYVTASTTALSVSPDNVEYATSVPTSWDGERLKLLVTGGMPPYEAWVISGSSLVSIVDPSLPLGEFEINNPDPGFASSVHESFVTVKDSKGNKVTVKVKLTVTAP